MPLSSTKPRMAPASSLAQTMKTSAIGELVIHILLPESRKPPGAARARVSMLPGSDPWLGSVSPKQPIHSPLASFGRYFSFCFSLPKTKIGSITSDDCTLIIERKPESTRSTSRAISP
jgi:hypothetical protein